MDELGTADIEEFRLPDSGTIKLSQIKTEFKKGNNLTSYYGVVSGIPSSGIIKVTDFYGKQVDTTPVAPSGSYSGAITHYQTTDPDNPGTPQFAYSNLWWCNGTGNGYPTSWGNQAGVFGADKASWNDCVSRKVAIQGQTAAVNAYYPYLRIGPTQGPADYRDYSGSWANRRLDNLLVNSNTNNPLETQFYTDFSNKSAAEYLYSIMQAGKSFYIAVSNGNKEIPIFESEPQEAEQ